MTDLTRPPQPDLEELLFAPTRRQGNAAPIDCEVVRPLTLDDLDEVLDGGTGLNPPKLGAVRTAHHLLAQLAAEGKSNIEIGLITGYSPNYVSILRADPAFKELLAHYATERDKVFVDALERMKALGVTALEELQERFAAEPEKFKTKELMEMVDMLLGPERATKGANAASGVSIAVQFVAPPTAKTIDSTPRAKEIEQ